MEKENFIKDCKNILMANIAKDDNKKHRENGHLVNFSDKINRLYKNIINLFTTKKRYNYNEIDKKWYSNSSINDLFGKGNEIEINQEIYKNLLGKIREKETCLNGLTELYQEFYKILPCEYIYKGKTWYREPSAADIEKQEIKNRETQIFYKKIEEERNDINKKIEEHNFNKEQGLYLYIYIGKNIVHKRSGKSEDVEIKKIALENDKHYSSSYYLGYDEPIAFEDSTVFDYNGKIYAIKCDTFTLREIKKLATLLEKDGFTVEKIYSGRGAYGATNYSLEIRRGEEFFSFITNSCNNDFETRFLPKVLKDDKIVFSFYEEKKEDTMGEKIGETEIKLSNKGGAEIYFSSIPSEETREILKTNGFRWSSFNRCWWIRGEQIEKAKNILSI